jgi:hypothetical protein
VQGNWRTAAKKEKHRHAKGAIKEFYPFFFSLSVSIAATGAK